MPLPLLPVAMGLIQAAPALLSLFDNGDDSTVSKVARAASDVAQRVTGTNTDDDALAAIKADPALMLEYQRQATDKAVAIAQEDTKRLQTVNETMRAEIASSNWWRAGWRPYWGYVAGTAFGAQMIGVTVAMFVHPAEIANIISALSLLFPFWGVAMAVLGVAVWKRSDDKKVAAGVPGVESVLTKVLRKLPG